MKDDQVAAAVPQQRGKLMNRAVRRRFKGGSSSGVSARPSGKTGQPAWFAEMKWDKERKATLSELPVSEFAVFGVCSEAQATVLHGAGYRTVWSVVAAEYKDLLKLHGFGPKVLGKIWQGAKIKMQVNMNWKVPSGT